MKITRRHVYYCNTVFVLAGITSISLNTLYFVRIIPIKNFIPSNYRDIETILILNIIAGCFVIVSAGFGCFANFKGSHFLMSVYSAILIGLFFFQLCLGSVSCARVQNRTELETQVLHYLEELYEAYFIDNKIRDDLDSLHKKKRCCGIDPFWDNYGEIICRESPYEKGCFNSLYKLLETSHRLLGIIILISSFLSLAFAIAAKYLSRKWRRKKTKESSNN